MRIPSSDGVEVVVHDLGGTGIPLLFSHATGFHGHSYLPIAGQLGDRFHSWALDHRGHGLTDRPHDWQVVWERYGDDALAAARAVAPDGGLVGFGHSMGGASLLMAAHRDPELFDLVVVFEPIVFPPPDSDAPHPSTPLIDTARRRRTTFASFDEAIANFASKPPMRSFTPDALRCYVEHGFVETADGVTLRCDPEHEARTFETGSTHGTWEHLPEIHTPVVVVAGPVEGASPAMISAAVAERLPTGQYVELAEVDHFWPMTHPADVAAMLRSLVNRPVQ